MTTAPRRLRPLICAAIALCASSPLLADLWYEHYQKGEDALRAQDWAGAVRHFTEAIQKRAEPGVNARTYGMNFVNYHPYLKLGIAYYNMGEFDRALKAFDTEEGYTAIAASRAELKNLETFRGLAREAARKAAQASDEERIASIVSRSLQEARSLERQGDAAGAMAALGPGLAVDPDNSELTALLKRVQEKAAGQESARDAAARVEKALSEGREMLAAGKYESASSRLKQALALDPANAEARRLLDESQAKLLAEVEAGRTAEMRRALVRDGVADAGRLESEGRLSEALERLQTALAMDPGHPEALELQSRIVKAQAASEGKKVREAEITRLLQEGIGLLERGDHERAVTSFNLLIALDPGHQAARERLASAYAAMSRALLSRGAAPAALKLPPVLALANAMRGHGGQGPAPEARIAPDDVYEMVSSPEFVLSGLILDDGPRVTISFQKDEAAREGGGEIVLSGEKMGNFYQYRFEQPFTLPARRTARVRILVVDADGLNAEAVHVARYVPPLWRSPWTYAAGGLALLVVLGSFLGLRVRRRGRLLRRRFNPYVAGAPVLDEGLFLGREALLDRILQTIHNNSVLLFGERRIGKTSLQHQIRRRLQQVQDPEYDFYPVFVDLQGTPQDRFFATLAEDTFQELAPYLDGARPGAGLPEGAPYTYETLVRDLRDVLRALRGRSSKKVKLVLLIDEVDELNAYDPKINQRLRSLFMKSFAEDLVAVVSGVGIKKHWESEGSPWYNFFEEIQVKPFRREDARELIEKPIRGVFRIDAGAADRIIEYTGCKPYLIQKLCIALVNRLHELGRRRITVADVEAIGRPQEE